MILFITNIKIIKIFNNLIYMIKKIKNGISYELNGWKYISINGKPKERGYAYGYLCADDFKDIQKTLKFFMMEAYGLNWDYFIEEINKDLGSIYFGSTQQLPLNAASSDYSSYKSNPPILPNQYSGSQVIITSGRLVFNSSLEHILLSSNKSVNFIILL